MLFWRRLSFNWGRDGQKFVWRGGVKNLHFVFPGYPILYNKNCRGRWQVVELVVKLRLSGKQSERANLKNA